MNIVAIYVSCEQCGNEVIMMKNYIKMNSHDFHLAARQLGFSLGYAVEKSIACAMPKPRENFDQNQILEN
jgi:hypothetical protein